METSAINLVKTRQYKPKSYVDFVEFRRALLLLYFTTSGYVYVTIHCMSCGYACGDTAQTDGFRAQVLYGALNGAY
jgi:hypothetical protein